MRLLKLLCLFVSIAASCGVGCNGPEQSQQIATDQELSEYGQASAPRAWKDGLEAMKQSTNPVE